MDMYCFLNIRRCDKHKVLGCFVRFCCTYQISDEEHRHRILNQGGTVV